MTLRQYAKILKKKWRHRKSTTSVCQRAQVPPQAHAEIQNLQRILEPKNIETDESTINFWVEISDLKQYFRQHWVSGNSSLQEFHHFFSV